MKNVLRSKYFIILLVFLTAVLFYIAYDKLKENPDVQVMSKNEGLYVAIAAISGAIVSVTTALSGIALKLLDYKKSMLELRIKEAELKKADKE